MTNRIVLFIKQQPGWYFLGCLVSFLAFTAYPTSIGWSIALATLFIIFYCLKFAEKQAPAVMDVARILLYFLFCTFSLLYKKFESPSYLLLFQSIPLLLLFSYFYSIAFVNTSMAENHELDKKTWILIASIQSVLIIGIGIWAISSKVEAEKQKALATDAIKETQRIQQLLKEYQKP